MCSECFKESNHAFRINLYYVCCIFDVCQEPCVEPKPTLASEIQIEEDDWMARAGEKEKATRVKSIQTVSKQ